MARSEMQARYSEILQREGASLPGSSLVADYDGEQYVLVETDLDGNVAVTVHDTIDEVVNWNLDTEHIREDGWIAVCAYDVHSWKYIGLTTTITVATTGVENALEPVAA